MDEYVQFEGKWLTQEEAAREKAKVEEIEEAVQKAANRLAPEIKMPKNKAELHALYLALSKKGESQSVMHPAGDRAEFFDYYSAWRDFEEHRRKLEAECEGSCDSFVKAADKIEKLMIVYVNVGSICATAVEKFVEDTKLKINLNSSRLPAGYEVIRIPTRRGETRIEIINL